MKFDNLIKNALVAASAIAMVILCLDDTTVFAQAKKPQPTKKPAATATKKPTSSAASKPKTSATPKAAATLRPPTNYTEAELPAALDAIVQSAKGSGLFGVEVRRLETGGTIYRHNETRGFIPASVRKVMTTCLALDQLGAEFRYRSYLTTDGQVDPTGVLNGDLVILPQGDPTFSSLLFTGTEPDWVYRDWAQKVKNRGIKRVRGELKVDCSAWELDKLKPKWPTRMLNDTYANFPGPLTVKENLMELIIKPAGNGAPATVQFRPDATGYPITNNTISGAGTPAFRVTRGANNRIQLSGHVTKQVAMTLPADNPALYAAAVFRSLLARQGISVDGQVTLTSKPTNAPTRENTIAMYASPPLKDILTLMNKKSENHLAEQVFVSTSAVKSRRGGYAGSMDLERTFLQKAGVDLSGFVGADGCGLSEETRVSPRQMTQLLSYMATQPTFSVLYDTLPVSGVDGTLRGRMGGETAGKVRAKTGTINGVVTLAGYVTTAPGQTYVFTIFVNKASRAGAKSAEDRICVALANAKP